MNNRNIEKLEYFLKTCPNLLRVNKELILKLSIKFSVSPEYLSILIEVSRLNGFHFN
jgi:hypothetical protein